MLQNEMVDRVSIPPSAAFRTITRSHRRPAASRKGGHASHPGPIIWAIIRLLTFCRPWLRWLRQAGDLCFLITSLTLASPALASGIMASACVKIEGSLISSAGKTMWVALDADGCAEFSHMRFGSGEYISIADLPKKQQIRPLRVDAVKNVHCDIPCLSGCLTTEKL